MKFEVIKNVFPGKQKGSSKQTKMNFQVNKNEVSSKQKWISR